jgi:phage terminase large subunit-like protein
MTEYNISKLYNQYCEDVLNKRITACKDIILACKRYKEWFKRDDIYFDYEDVDKRIKLVSKMKHWKGKCAGQPFILLPYQQWIFANLFGWKYKESALRVTRKALLFVARKAG